MHTVHGRNVIESGVLLIGPDETELTLNLDDLRYIIAFYDEDIDAEIRTQQPDIKSLRLEIHGNTTVLSGVGFALGEIGNYYGEPLHCTLLVKSVGDDKKVRSVQYTFSGGSS